MMYRFCISLHALPTSAIASRENTIKGVSVVCLEIKPEQSHLPLDVSFEEAVVALNQLTRMFCEPDGSFVWRGDDQGGWQVDGVLFDRAGKLIYIELRGKCPAQQFDDILRSLGWPKTKIMFQLVAEGVFVDEATLRQLLQIIVD